jgi:tetratricopeptide (TPR) repeat protein
MAYAYRADAYFQLGDNGHALSDCGEALTKQPKPAIALAFRAQLYLDTNELDKAMTDCNEALRLDDKLVLALVFRATCYALQGDANKSAADFERAIQINKEDPAIYDARARVALRRLALGETNGDADKQRRNQEDAFDDADRAVQKAPHYAPYLGTRALVTLEKANSSKDGGALLRDKALKDAEDGIKNAPKSLRALFVRAEVYHRMGDDTKALEDITAALKLNEKYAPALELRGRIYKSGKSALDEFDKAIAADPRCLKAWVSRARLHRAEHAHDQAVADYSKAIEMSPYCYEAFLERGEIYRLPKQLHAEAVKDFTQAIQLNPNNTWPYAYRGETRRMLKQYTEAIEDSDAAIKLMPRNAFALATRGAAYHQMGGHTQEALKDLNAAIEINDRNSFAYRFRSYAREAAGDKENAQKDLETANALSASK